MGEIWQGKAFPSLLPHVIPAKAGISMCHQLPLLAGNTPATPPPLKKKEDDTPKGAALNVFTTE